MLKVAVLVSGGGTNLQAIIDGVKNGSITNTSIQMVVSNNKNAYALKRAEDSGIEAKAISPKDLCIKVTPYSAKINKVISNGSPIL